MYPRPNGEMYLCGLGGSDYVDPPRLKAGGDCDKPEVILPDPARVAAATRSFKGMTSIGNESPEVTQVGVKFFAPRAEAGGRRWVASLCRSCVYFEVGGGALTLFSKVYPPRVGFRLAMTPHPHPSLLSSEATDYGLFSPDCRVISTPRFFWGLHHHGLDT